MKLIKNNVHKLIEGLTLTEVKKALKVQKLQEQDHNKNLLFMFVEKITMDNIKSQNLKIASTLRL